MYYICHHVLYFTESHFVLWPSAGDANLTTWLQLCLLWFSTWKLLFCFSFEIKGVCCCVLVHGKIVWDYVNVLALIKILPSIFSIQRWFLPVSITRNLPNHEFLVPSIIHAFLLHGKIYLLFIYVFICLYNVYIYFDA